MVNKIKKKVVFNKEKNPLEKFGMLGKEEGFTRVKDLPWLYGNKCLGISPTMECEKNKKV